MNFIITPTHPHHGGGDLGKLDPMARGKRGPLRHLLIGIPQRIRATQRRLHTCRYIDIQRWSPLMPIGEDGLIIQPTPEEVCAYLQLPDPMD